MKLVILQDNTPVVSHRVISEHTNMQEKSVSRIIRNLTTDFEEFGRVGFEIHTLDTKGGVQEIKTYYLNEQQVTLLLTYLRNSEIVRKFKVTLVKEFYELKERNTVPYELLYAKERECIELKRAMNRITENTPFILNDPQTHNDTLEFLGYASRAAKTMRQLASDTAEYAENMERFVASIQKRHGNIKGVTTQCNRLPRHKEKKD